MKMNIMNWMRKAVVWTSLIWDNTLSVFCLSLVTVFLAIGNHTLLFLLPLCICFDLLILVYSVNKEYKDSFYEMNKNSQLFNNLVRADEDMETKFQNEVSKTWQFTGGDRFGTKRIASYISKKLADACTSYSFYSDESIILLHNQFDYESDLDCYSWIHEMSHCSWHSLINQKRISTTFHSVCLSLLILAAAFITQSWYIFLVGIVLCLLMLFAESHLYVFSKREMDADAMALTIFGNIYGKERMKRVARIFTNRYYSELLAAESVKEGQQRINPIYNFLRFATKEDQKKFLSKLNAQILDVDKNNTPGGKLQRIKLKALALNVSKRELPQLDSFNNAFLTLNSPLYYIVFPALILLACIALNKVTLSLTLPWWCLLLAVVPIVLLFILKKRTENLVIMKSFYVENISTK